ncbi:class I SAM-dependent methyltransferase [Tepidibacter hydrothermalis]|uniref:Class I SAM-dependent methyltransferase n=1 Tax=Tepidibacter hydrothermalis TaxID=3036126 RepID=A0ABY8EA48_9FIRM|nr:class I SAM-dependent methyltransferase [Tepidibacter hydrothermalis]WFD09676.1 class I SAM-dependent methyltransferase [Tepidibacter hydrothermalis]
MKSQVDFFNTMASKWDEIIYVDNDKINYALDKTNIKKGSKILDVGTGTGVMIPFLIERIEEEGKIMAVDVAQKMLLIAEDKFKDNNRVSFFNLNVEIDTIEEKFDLIVCYSVFPHFENKTRTIKKLVNKNLRENGSLLIFHSQSKEDINKIHKQADDIVSEDKLIDLKTQKIIFENEGLNIIDGIDNKDMYLILINKINSRI